MPLFGGGSNQDKLKQRLAELFMVLGKSAIGSTASLHEKRSEFSLSDEAFSGSKYMKVSLEFLYLYLHLVDRIAFSNIGISKRDALIDLTYEPCIKSMVTGFIKSSPQGELEKIVDSATDGFQEAQAEYGPLKEINLTEQEVMTLVVSSGLGTEITPSLAGSLGSNIAQALGTNRSIELAMAVNSIIGDATEQADFRKLVTNVGVLL